MKMLTSVLAGMAALAAHGQTPPGGASPQPATPVDPIAAIANAFRSHQLVGLGNIEGGNQQSHDFQLTLIRDPRFTAVVNDIVVEFGNSRYQDMMDRFVRGEEIPYDSLKLAWQNTTQVEFEWDLPPYEEFFRKVRTINSSLPRDRQIRVLLGDPPIDWDQVHTLQDLQAGMGDRDAHAVEVIRREVLQKNRRALIIYGSQHLLRKNLVPGATDEWARGLVAQLERPGIAQVFTVLPETRRDLTAIQPDVAMWPKPSLAMLKGTQLGAMNSAVNPRQRQVNMEDQADALLYLGPPSGMTAVHLSPALCSDPKYVEMRVSRFSLVGAPTGAPSPADLLKQACGGQPSNR